jgi:hypothetical protein
MGNIPNMVGTSARGAGRYLNGTVNPIMIIPPLNRAAELAPVATRPRLNIVALIEVGHRITPTSKTTKATR